MVKKGQPTGIFDLEDVDTIRLGSKSKEDSTVVIGNPQILVDATNIK